MNFIFFTSLKSGFRNVLFLSILWFVILPVFSQKDFRPAYLIDLNNDTIYGFVNYNGNLFNECEYKKTLDSEVVRYTPFSINAFRFIDDKYYISKEVEIRNSYTKIAQLEFSDSYSNGVITESKYTLDGKSKEKVFLEYLLDGELDLYFLKDKNMFEHYYLETKVGRLMDLTIEVTQAYYNGGMSIRTKNTYQGILKGVMKDCPQLFNEVSKTDFSHKDLIKVTSDYHNYVCKDQKCIIYERKISPIKVRLSLFGSLGYSSIKYISYSLYGKYIESSFKDKIFFMAGSEIHFRDLIPNLKRLTFKVRMEYWNGIYTTDEFYIGNINHTVNVKYNSSNLDLSLFGVQHFSTKSTTPYISIGLSCIYSIRNSLNANVRNSANDNVDYFTFNDNNKPFGLGGVFGIGYEFSVFKKSKIFIELMHKQRANDYNTNFILGYEF